MPPPEPDAQEMVAAQFTLRGEGFEFAFRATVPKAPTQLAALLPVVRTLSDAIVGETVRAVEQAGEAISCRKGCGACCRNLVAISEVEARRIRDLVQALPEARRAALRERFAAARERLHAAGLLDTLRAAERCGADEYRALVGEYFALGIACPFLEDESCSIHDERPLTCREHLVISPPVHCAQRASPELRRVRLPLAMFSALARMPGGADGAFLERWVPLVLAPEWADEHPDRQPPRPGLELLRELLAHVND